jgi:hypothetical protein
MKPIIILAPNQMSEANIEELRKNDLCVVVAEDPAKVKFVDPIPAQSSRTQIEDAAIRLSRRILNGNHGYTVETTAHFSKMFVELLICGTPLDAQGDEHERRQRHYDWAFKDEIEKLARADAKAEREAKKKAAAEAKK